MKEEDAAATVVTKRGLRNSTFQSCSVKERDLKNELKEEDEKLREMGTTRFEE